MYTNEKEIPMKAAVGIISTILLIGIVIGVIVLNSITKDMSKEEGLIKEFSIEVKNSERNIHNFEL
ncbi:hypothetical protein R9X47_10010 [Wukongibacter baidiensis]|uniref:hypothetical protein n=1 Tax=Wukongibacter baidiensis TaxID=1723361 RepID=UPI003D7FD62A